MTRNFSKTFFFAAGSSAGDPAAGKHEGDQHPGHAEEAHDPGGGPLQAPVQEPQRPVLLRSQRVSFA